MAYLWAVNKSNGCQRLLWSGQCEPCICARLGKVLPVGHRGSSSPLFLEYCIGGGAGKLLGGLGCEGRLAEGAASPRSLLTSCLSGLPISIIPLNFHDCGLAITVFFSLHISECSTVYSGNSFCDSLSFPVSGQTNILELCGVSVNQEEFQVFLSFKFLSSRLPVPKCHQLMKSALLVENSMIKCALKSPFLD